MKLISCNNNSITLTHPSEFKKSSYSSAISQNFLSPIDIGPNYASRLKRNRNQLRSLFRYIASANSILRKEIQRKIKVMIANIPSRYLNMPRIFGIYWRMRNHRSAFFQK